MFIVNQDRNTTINMENVKEISLHGKQIFADDTVIGKYGTEERTDQVYNEMLQTLFSPYMMLKKCRVAAGRNEKLCKRKCDSAEKCGQRA